MNKKAQVTIIAILGILILAGVFFLLYLRGALTFIKPGASLEEELVAINTHILTCLHDISDQESNYLGRQGGYLAILDDSYRYFNDTKVSYLCYDMQDTLRCRSRLLLKQDMEESLSKNIKLLLASCINLNEFASKTYSIEPAKEWIASTIIGDNSITVNLDYPIKIVSKQTSEQITNDKYAITLNYPLGSLHKLANTIVADESTVGNFDPLPYMLENPQYKILKLKPYPDKIYIIKKTDSPFIFQFAIQG